MLEDPEGAIGDSIDSPRRQMAALASAEKAAAKAKAAAEASGLALSINHLGLKMVVLINP